MVRTLPRVIAAPSGKPVPEDGAELRRLARQIAGDPGAWTPEPASLVAGLFEEMASTWDTEHATGRLDFLTDALARGGPLPSGICLELGSGTGRRPVDAGQRWVTPLVLARGDDQLGRDLRHRDPALTQAACISDHVVVEHLRPAAVAAALAG